MIDEGMAPTSLNRLFSLPLSSAYTQPVFTAPLLLALLNKACRSTPPPCGGP